MLPKLLSKMVLNLAKPTYSRLLVQDIPKVSLVKLAILVRLLVHAMGCLKGCAPRPHILMCLSPNFHYLRM